MINPIIVPRLIPIPKNANIQGRLMGSVCMYVNMSVCVRERERDSKRACLATLPCTLVTSEICWPQLQKIKRNPKKGNTAGLEPRPSVNRERPEEPQVVPCTMTFA